MLVRKTGERARDQRETLLVVQVELKPPKTPKLHNFYAKDQTLKGNFISKQHSYISVDHGYKVNTIFDTFKNKKRKRLRLSGWIKKPEPVIHCL